MLMQADAGTAMLLLIFIIGSGICIASILSRPIEPRTPREKKRKKH